MGVVGLSAKSSLLASVRVLPACCAPRSLLEGFGSNEAKHKCFVARLLLMSKSPEQIFAIFFFK